MPNNSANPGLGTLQKPLMLGDINLTKFACDCVKDEPYTKVANIPVPDYVKCLILGTYRHRCVDKKIKDAKEKSAQKGSSDPNGEVHSGSGHKYGSLDLPAGKNFCRPDIIIGAGTMPLEPKQITKIVELKFPCNKGKELPSSRRWKATKVMSGAQKRCYKNLTKYGGGPTKGKNGIPVHPVGPTKETCK